MLYQGTRNTSGNGTAILTPATGKRLRTNGVLKLQLKEAGPVNVLVKMGSTTIYTAYIKDDGAGELVQLPVKNYGVDEALYINLDAAKAVLYVIDVDEVEGF